MKVVAGLSAIKKDNLNTGTLLSIALTRLYSTGLTSLGPAIIKRFKNNYLYNDNSMILLFKRYLIELYIPTTSVCLLPCSSVMRH